MNRDTVIKKIAVLKTKRFGEVCISAVHNGAIYQLEPVTSDAITHPDLIKLFSRWRKRNEQWFLAQFPISEVRTKKWVEEQLTNKPDRLLFMIRVGNEYIGHVGLYRFDWNNSICQLDNVIRGEIGYPGLMGSALRTLMQWGKKELGLNTYGLQTTSDNSRALAFYGTLGFVTARQKPLVYRKTSSGSKWMTSPLGYTGIIKRYEVYMEMRTMNKKAQRSIRPRTPKPQNNKASVHNSDHIDKKIVRSISPSNKKISFAGPSITKKEIAYVIDGTKNGFYETYDQHTKKLEAAVCAVAGVKYGIATHCCTQALHLACATLDLKKGDEVICTDFSWIATAYAIAYTGATPIFVDIDPNTWCIDPVAIEKAITKKTKAIMLVHTFGHPADMDAIMRIAREYKLRVIEDAAPALGATYKNKSVGSFGDIACFSFQGAKIVAAGEGGIFLTNNKALFEKAKLLASMGRTDSKAVFWSDGLGYQYTIANLSAALALSQVERLDELVVNKRRIYGWYAKRLKGVSGMSLLKEQPKCFSNYCYPSLMLDADLEEKRDWIVAEFKKLNIHARPAFPRMSRMPAFPKARFANPVAEAVEKRGISLPAAHNLTEKDVDFVCRALINLLDL